MYIYIYLIYVCIYVYLIYINITGATSATSACSGRQRSAGAASVVLRLMNVGALRAPHTAEEESALAHAHAVAVPPIISSVMRNSKDLAAAVDRKAGVLWRSMALVVSRQV